MSLPKTFLGLPLLSVILLSGCASSGKPGGDLNLRIEGYNPPKFRISGPGTLDIIAVAGPDADRQCPEGGSPYTKDYWVIIPKEDYEVSRLEELGPLTYGQVPEGFEQFVPPSGEVPPIVEGKTYNIRLRTKNGPAASRFFVLHDGKIIATGY